MNSNMFSVVWVVQAILDMNNASKLVEKKGNQTLNL